MHPLVALVVLMRYAPLIAALLAALGAWQAQAWRFGAQLQQQAAQHAQQLQALADQSAQAGAQYRTRERAWQTQIDQQAHDGQTALDNARRDADRARTERDGLRADLSRYRAGAAPPGHPGAASAGPTASAALDVLADLFSRADDAAAELARALDAAHAAAVTCEGAYDALVK